MTTPVVSVRTYTIVFALLLVLTLVTYGAAHVNFGVLSLAVALLIAAVKGSLVALFFMHVRHSSRLTWLVIAASLSWLGLLLIPTLADYFTRARLRPPTDLMSPVSIVRKTLER